MDDEKIIKLVHSNDDPYLKSVPIQFSRGILNNAINFTYVRLYRDYSITIQYMQKIFWIFKIKRSIKIDYAYNIDRNKDNEICSYPVPEFDNDLKFLRTYFYKHNQK